jgi:hypothetical protein
MVMHVKEREGERRGPNINLASSPLGCISWVHVTRPSSLRSDATVPWCIIIHTQTMRCALYLHTSAMHCPCCDQLATSATVIRRLLYTEAALGAFEEPTRRPRAQVDHATTVVGAVPYHAPLVASHSTTRVNPQDHRADDDDPTIVARGGSSGHVGRANTDIEGIDRPCNNDMNVCHALCRKQPHMPCQRTDPWRGPRSRRSRCTRR